jgi:DNA-directed RNA polymerase subunit F
MVNPELINEDPINMIELKEELDKIKESGKELSFRANKTLEYINQFSMPSKKDIITLFEKLTKLDIPRLKKNHINKIIDIMPTDVEQLKVVLQGYTVTVNNENMKKIVDIIKEFIPKKIK